MAASFPGTVEGNQSGRFLGTALAPGVQAVLRRLRGEAGRQCFRTRTGGRRARCVLHVGDHARLWRVGRWNRNGAVLRHVLLPHDGRRLYPRDRLAGEDGVEGAGPVGLVVVYGVDVLLG